ncbi:SH3 domain-binding protein 5-like, partial [Centroberyx affinis]|uniref:SH3 domain-binding protein 5-like n=1 Tax=Centroberyx affinis TaxID=166261 RepID=UPI003A5BB5AE
MDHLEKENRSDEETEYEDEEVDPRIQGELEKLNQSTDDINRCETELEDARQKFRSVLVEATVKLDELVKKIGKAVEESKPYWEARRVARQHARERLWIPREELEEVSGEKDVRAAAHHNAEPELETGFIDGIDTKTDKEL